MYMNIPQLGYAGIAAESARLAMPCGDGNVMVDRCYATMAGRDKGPVYGLISS